MDKETWGAEAVPNKPLKVSTAEFIVDEHQPQHSVEEVFYNIKNNIKINIRGEELFWVRLVNKRETPLNKFCSIFKTKLNLSKKEYINIKNN